MGAFAVLMVNSIQSIKLSIHRVYKQKHISCQPQTNDQTVENGFVDELQKAHAKYLANVKAICEQETER